jgi:energy-coupling factor transport system permease protein
MMMFKLCHPLTALVYYAGLLVLLFTCVNPVYRLIITAGVIVLALCCVRRKNLFCSLRFLLPLVFILGLLNPLFVRRGATILFYLFGNPVTLEATLFGFNQSLLILSTIVLFISFNKIIDHAAFLYLTARWMPRTALVISIALNTMARLKNRIVALTDVQKTRGMDMKKNKIKTGLWLLNLFTVRSLEEGLETAVVLKARDYGITRRTSYRAYGFGLRDAFNLFIMLFLFTLLLISIDSYVFYPRMQPLMFSYSIIPLLVYVLWPLIIAIPRRITTYVH